MKFWNFFRSAEAMEVIPVVMKAEFGDTEDIVVEFNEPEGLLPQARLRMTRAQAVAMCSAVLVLSGCSTIGGVCDETRIEARYSHVSHPFAGPPFGPKEEEDALDTIGPMGRCTVGRGYVEIGTGWKLGDGGFYGPGLTGTMNIGMVLWESK
jgi:hypothetical protein